VSQRVDSVDPPGVDPGPHDTERERSVVTRTNPTSARGVTWALVEDGFHVGSRDGEFLGYIERRGDRRFDAFNLHSRHAGTFPDLASAMRELSTERTEVLTEVRAERSR
jgi:hypothetical protein